MYVGVPTDPPRGARRLTARPADPQGLGQPRGGEGPPPPPPYSPPNFRTPLGVTHWLAPAPVLMSQKMTSVALTLLEKLMHQKMVLLTVWLKTLHQKTLL